MPETSSRNPSKTQKNKTKQRSTHKLSFFLTKKKNKIKSPKISLKQQNKAYRIERESKEISRERDKRNG